jgi:hypothetical protein
MNFLMAARESTYAAMTPEYVKYDFKKEAAGWQLEQAWTSWPVPRASPYVSTWRVENIWFT